VHSLERYSGRLLCSKNQISRHITAWPAVKIISRLFQTSCRSRDLISTRCGSRRAVARLCEWKCSLGGCREYPRRNPSQLVAWNSLTISFSGMWERYVQFKGCSSCWLPQNGCPVAELKPRAKLRQSLVCTSSKRRSIVLRVQDLVSWVWLRNGVLERSTNAKMSKNIQEKATTIFLSSFCRVDITVALPHFTRRDLSCEVEVD
jgi:hypothetical protein